MYIKEIFVAQHLLHTWPWQGDGGGWVRTCPGHSAHATKRRTQRSAQVPRTDSKRFLFEIQVNNPNKSSNRKRERERPDRRKIFITLDKIWKTSSPGSSTGKHLTWSKWPEGDRGMGNREQNDYVPLI